MDMNTSAGMRWQDELGPVGEVGFKQAMQRKWISLDKQGLVTRQVGHL